MSNPLITIAVPTWNRASILDYALSLLLTQIQIHKDKIEIIISDNNSDDNTNEIIKKHFLLNKDLNIIHNTQEKNTGYYGNFKICRHLSKGKYFWLLSDNDFIANGLIDYIIKIIEEEDTSFIFLKDWKQGNKIDNKVVFRKKTYPLLQAVEKFSYNTTLISAVIFKNNKVNDLNLFNHFKGNTFLGFSFFLEALSNEKNAVEITGNSLFISKAKVSFNAFKSFAEDLVACFQYAIKNNILPTKTVNVFINKTITELTTRHYILFRLTGSLHGVKYDRGYIDKMLHKGFSDYKAYKEILKPLVDANGIYFYTLVVKKHMLRIIKNQLK